MNYFHGNVRIVEISAEAIAMVLSTGYAVPAIPGNRVVCVEGLPEGAKLRGAEFDAFKGSVRLLFEHESFAPPPTGDPIPYLNPVFRTERVDP